MFPENEIVRWMEKALALAERAREIDEVPVGAILVHEGKALASGYNLREKTKKAIAHAEIQALELYSHQNNQWRLPMGTSLFVTAEPCLMCTGALLWARVDHIYYGCKDPKNAGLRRLSEFIDAGVYDHRFQTVQNGILEERCSSLMSDYFKSKRK